LAAVEQENAKLNALLRRTDLRIETITSELEQKEKENDQLNCFADELMGKGDGNYKS